MTHPLLAATPDNFRRLFMCRDANFIFFDIIIAINDRHKCDVCARPASSAPPKLTEEN